VVGRWRGRYAAVCTAASASLPRRPCERYPADADSDADFERRMRVTAQSSGASAGGFCRSAGMIGGWSSTRYKPEVVLPVRGSGPL